MIPGKVFRLEDVFAGAYRQKWVVLIPFLLLGVTTAVVTKFMPSRYRSEAVILVVPQRVPESYGQSTVTAGISDRLQTISQQILSRTALERVIEEFKLYPVARKTEIMEDVIESMRKNIKIDIQHSAQRTM